MSIEQSLERIATALEQMVGTTKDKTGQPELSERKEDLTPKKERKPKAPSVISPEEPSSTATVSLEDLTNLLRKHASALGIPSTKALMVKFGADAETPNVNSIPTNNYGTLAEAAKKDLGGK